MAAKSQFPWSVCTFFAILFFVILIGSYFAFILGQWRNLKGTVEKLHRQNIILEWRLNKTMAKPGKFENLTDPPIYFDEPTKNLLPRMVSNGVFPKESSELLPDEEKTEGRKSGDLENVAILLEVHDKNDTERWINTVKRMLKSKKDLHLFLFSKEFNYRNLRKLAKNQVGVSALQKHGLNASIYHIFHHWHKDFIIIVNDSDYLGSDFADFYFFGKSVMQFDENIDSVCGGSNEKWQNNEMGDVFWVSDAKCDKGRMISLHTKKNSLSVRPEVARVGKSQKSVTDTTWNIDKFNPKLLKLETFERHLEYDFGNAKQMKKNSWNKLSLEERDEILMFPYANLTELEEYVGEEAETLQQYKGIIPLNKDNYKVYLVPEYTFQNGWVKDNFKFH